jgi:hypothetical protein
MRLPSGWQCPSAASGPSSRCDLGLGDADRSPGAAVRQPVEDDRPDGIQGDPQRQQRGATTRVPQLMGM